ncbi:diguanylate cyclase [Pseudoalteromonas spongiae]|uniref:diguanylate cyclase n=1 Tax=Pseudoalteromonas spongiae TaxID=298657 RepID=UPI0018E1F5DA|nr:diguanylate cyclase [Pseudoalteromonas spongiae]
MPINLKPLADSKILVVDDDLLMRKVLSTILKDICYVDVLSDSTQVINYCTSGVPPDLILLDVHMPNINGLEVCKQLRTLEAMNDVPIIFVTASVEVKSQNECWEAGGSDFISKPIAPSTLVHRVKAHLLNKARLEQLEKLTYKDSLTGLYNRHYLNEHSLAIVKQVQRQNESIALLMLDLDFFKRFNDLYGHQAGDDCLKDAAEAIVESLKRPQDVAVRYGGEEFLIILPYTDLTGLEHVAKNILSNIKKKNIKHAESPFEYVSFSIGGALSHTKSCEYSLEAMIKIADENLYEAKRLGKNQFVMLNN